MVSILAEGACVSTVGDGRRRVDPRRNGVRRGDLGLAHLAAYVGKSDGVGFPKLSGS